MKITLKRQNNEVHLKGTNESGKAIDMDGSPEIGGQDMGVRPMETVLMGLGGCASMDVLSILKKMREDIVDYEVEIEADRAEDHPKVFTKINMHFKFYGNIKKENVEKALRLSMEKYCSVTHMLNKTATITDTFEIIPV
jgi:putative redox protein